MSAIWLSIFLVVLPHPSSQPLQSGPLKLLPCRLQGPPRLIIRLLAQGLLPANSAQLINGHFLLQLAQAGVFSPLLPVGQPFGPFLHVEVLAIFFLPCGVDHECPSGKSVQGSAFRRRLRLRLAWFALPATVMPLPSCRGAPRSIATFEGFSALLLMRHALQHLLGGQWLAIKLRAVHGDQLLTWICQESEPSFLPPLHAFMPFNHGLEVSPGILRRPPSLFFDGLINGNKVLRPQPKLLHYPRPFGFGLVGTSL